MCMDERAWMKVHKASDRMSREGSESITDSTVNEDDQSRRKLETVNWNKVASESGNLMNGNEKVIDSTYELEEKGSKESSKDQWTDESNSERKCCLENGLETNEGPEQNCYLISPSQFGTNNVFSTEKLLECLNEPELKIEIEVDNFLENGQANFTEGKCSENFLLKTCSKSSDSYSCIQTDNKINNDKPCEDSSQRSPEKFSADLDDSDSDCSVDSADDEELIDVLENYFDIIGRHVSDDDLSDITEVSPMSSMTPSPLPSFFDACCNNNESNKSYKDCDGVRSVDLYFHESSGHLINSSNNHSRELIDRQVPQFGGVVVRPPTPPGIGKETQDLCPKDSPNFRGAYLSSHCALQLNGNNKHGNGEDTILENGTRNHNEKDSCSGGTSPQIIEENSNNISVEDIEDGLRPPSDPNATKTDEPLGGDDFQKQLFGKAPVHSNFNSKRFLPRFQKYFSDHLRRNCKRGSRRVETQLHHDRLLHLHQYLNHHQHHHHHHQHHYHHHHNHHHHHHNHHHHNYHHFPSHGSRLPCSMHHGRQQNGNSVGPKNCCQAFLKMNKDINEENFHFIKGLNPMKIIIESLNKKV